MTNFDLAGFGIGSICPGNELLYDDVGFPSVMVRVPKMTLSQLGMGDSTAVHPAFIINGKEVDALWIGKFQSAVHDGRAYSLPARDPAAGISWEDAYNACIAKGNGWHLMTRMEVGALTRWCESNGFIPNGNNNYGKDTNEDAYKAIPTAYNDSGQITRVATGTGPLTWSHNGELGGIYDLNGNLYEHNGGTRLVHGELQILEDNNGADPNNSQSPESAEWKAIDAATGALVTPDGSGTTEGTVKMDRDMDDGHLVYSTTVRNAANSESGGWLYLAECDGTIGEQAKLLLQCLGMFPYSENELIVEKYTPFYMNNGAEESLCASGGQYATNWATVATFGMSIQRAFLSPVAGFRVAYAEF